MAFYRWIFGGFLALACLVVAAYFYATRKFNYWKKRGVKELKPTAFLGNLGDCCFFRKSPGEFFKDLYAAGRGSKYLGFYVFDKPALVLRDPELIKAVLIRDFHHFSNRYVETGDYDKLGKANLFMIKNPHWKMLRNKLTPVFTSGKIKHMFTLMDEVSRDLETHLEYIVVEDKGKDLELKEICAKYGTDVIATCAYGLKVNSLNNPDAEFRKCGRRIFDFNYWRGMEVSCLFFAPDFGKYMGFRMFSKNDENFLRDALWGTLMSRMKSGSHRNDLIDTLVELKKTQNQAKNDAQDPTAFEYDGDNLVAQAAVFFTAGFETSASTMSFAMYELALQPHLQTRLRDEIASALENCGVRLTYETVMQLPYLDMVISETLRKYPPLPFLDRVAGSDYKLPGTDVTIEKGTPVYVPMYGTHYDPEYFPDPERFDPERFSDENKRSRPSCVYMPFGEGPHNCIGMRFGLLQSKLGLVRILAKYEVTPCSRTMIPIRLNPKALILAPDGGLYLNLRQISATTK